MPGNIVPLYLCKTCKGLFVFESQAENHQVKCNGDAFNSPANLFVCEREPYLELITPSPSVPGPKASKKSQQKSQLCERKRRKTSPQINATPETRVTGRSFLSKDDLSTLTPGSHKTTGPHVRDANRRTVPRSRSLPQANVVTSPQNNPLNPNTYSATGQSSSHQNILNSVVSLGTPLSQSFVFAGNASAADRMTCSFSPANHGDISFSSSAADLQAVDSDRHHSSDSETVMIQESSTPATNLLAYFNQLQQDRGTSALQPAIQTGKEKEFPNIVQRSVSVDNQADLYLVLDNNSVEDASVVKSSSVQESSVSVVQDVTLPVNGSNEQNGHVNILTRDIQLEDFQFKTVSATSNGSGTNQILDQTVYAQHIDDFLTFVPSVSVENGKPAQMGSALDSLQSPVYQVGGSDSCTYTELATSTPDSSMHLKTEALGEDMVVYKNADTVQPFQTECSSSPAVHVFDGLSKVETGIANPSSSHSQESSIPGSVVLFLKPDGQFIQTTMAVNNGTDVSTPMNMENMQLCAGSTMQVQVCDSVTVQDDSRNGEASHQMSSMTEPSDNKANSTGMDTGGGGGSFVQTGNNDVKGVMMSTTTTTTITTRAKTKSQIRQEELSALREEVLLQAREIPVEGEAKKLHYNCNVCGHVAKSVKFMHNHLQMHADGKTHFECDQCDFKSRLRSKVTEHQQRHTRSRLLCHLCPSTFMDTASLNRHVSAKHSENEDLKCEWENCDFKTSYASLLKDHMAKHTGEFLCCDVDGCNYKTPYQRALRVHQKRHSCEKNYRCQLCSYEVLEKSTLDRHMKSHTQERPFQCNVCDFRANTKYSVVVHMQHKHGGQPQKSCYACDKCSFFTASAASMATHLKTHLSSFTCPLCSHTTCTLASIKKHLHQQHQIVNLEVVQEGEAVKMEQQAKSYLFPSQPPSNTPLPSATATSSTLVPAAHKGLMENCPDKALMEEASQPASSHRSLMETSDKVFLDSSAKCLMDSLLLGDAAMSVDSQDLPPFPLITDMDHRPHHMDPMKLSLFQDPGPLLGSGSGTGGGGGGSSLTRASSIPDLSTFAGMNRTNSQTDMLSFPGVSTVTRSNSMSDLLSFANAICPDAGEAMSMAGEGIGMGGEAISMGGEAINMTGETIGMSGESMGISGETITLGGEAIHMDVSLSDAASAASMDVRGLSLEDSSLSDEVMVMGKAFSPGSILVTLQCSKCLLLLTTEEDVERHKKICRGAILVV